MTKAILLSIHPKWAKKIYSDDILAKFNESCPKELHYEGDIVGHIDHVQRDGDCFIATIYLNKKIGNPHIGIRGLADISKDGECRVLKIESIDFISAKAEKKKDLEKWVEEATAKSGDD